LDQGLKLLHLRLRLGVPRAGGDGGEVGGERHHAGPLLREVGGQRHAVGTRLLLRRLGAQLDLSNRGFRGFGDSGASRGREA